MSTINEKYARLLVNYCLAVKKGDKVYITSTYLAEPLIKEVVKETYMAGGLPVVNVELDGLGDIALKYGEEHQLTWMNPMRKYVMENFDCYLSIMAPFEKAAKEKDEKPADPEKFKLSQKVSQELNKIYFERIGNGSMRRCLCLPAHKPPK